MTGRNEGVATVAIALVALAIGFCGITWMRRPADAIVSRMSEPEALLAAYHSPSGFKPFVYVRRSPEEWYTMLDIFPEEGDYVRWVNLQIILPGRGHDLLRTYVHGRANCRTWQATTIGDGETIQDMNRKKPDDHFWDLTPGSIDTNSAYTACRQVGKV